MAFMNESPAADANLIINTITSDYRTKRTNQLVGWSYANLRYATKVSRTVKTNIPQAVLTLNGLEIPTNKLVGYVFLPARVEASAPVGYTFIGWKDSQGNLISTDREYDLKYIHESVTACFESDEALQRPVRINEVSAANNIFVNESFKKHDWVELYNVTSSSIDVSGMFLSDDLTKPEKYVIPEGSVISANGYLVIWCDKESGTQLHAPFKLDNKERNAVILTAKDHSWADTLVYKSHTGFQSVGLYPDGGNNSYVMNRPSIGKTNNLSDYDSVDKENLTVIRSVIVNDKEGIIYNLLGQPVQTPQPGQLYIRNGRKYIYRP